MAWKREKSANATKNPRASAPIKTTSVARRNSATVGQHVFRSSATVSPKNRLVLPNNAPTNYLPPSQPPQLAGEEGIEPPTYGFGDRCSAKLSYSPPAKRSEPLQKWRQKKSKTFFYRPAVRWWRIAPYSKISVTRPAPTVLPPSRMAKRWPLSMAIAFCNATSMPRLSPGIIISVPSGSLITPVTSVVRK